MPKSYFLIGTWNSVDVFEEFATRDAAHARWDELHDKNENCINFKIKEVEVKKRPTKPLTLSEKIFRITQEASTIERKGVGESNDLEHPLFAYVRIEDVLDVINPLLKKYKLILTGQVPKEPMTHVSKGFATTEVMVEWTLEDTESFNGCYGVRTWRIPGAGVDDQGKGCYKAMTGSRKYACVFIFNLKFGDEPEERNAGESERHSSDESSKESKALPVS